ncbi:MAG: hypothetical protein KDH89_19430, partial [Anaerolineae bacterium]|nr:hypothetical protein [Anaerolineae bacterium]
MKISRTFKIAIVLLGIVLLAGSQLLHAAPGEDRSLQAAWEAAVARGGYEFTTTIQQTAHPLPKLVNVGLGSKTDNIYIEGKTDSHVESMQMKLWSDGGSAALGTGALEIKVEDGKAYGRTDQEPWREMDDVTGLFAPGQDAFGFLHAATNVVADQQASSGYTIYHFDLDGVAFASYMRDGATAELERSGQLPQSYELELSPHFVNMTGSGELWVDDATGLPLRQIIDVQFPPDKYEQVDARITTDFANWSRPATAGGVLAGLIDGAFTPAAIARVQGFLAAVLGGMIFLAVLMQYRKSRKFYGALALALIAIMVIGPTLEADRAQAFIADQKTQQATYDERQQARQREAQ